MRCHPPDGAETPVGKRLTERSKTPMLSSPREAAAETDCGRCASLRLTHHVKFNMQLSEKHRSRESRDRARPRFIDRQAGRRASTAQACTGGLTSPKANS